MPEAAAAVLRSLRPRQARYRAGAAPDGARPSRICRPASARIAGLRASITSAARLPLREVLGARLMGLRLAAEKLTIDVFETDLLPGRWFDSWYSVPSFEHCH